MLTDKQKKLYEVASYLSSHADFFNKNNCFYRIGKDDAMLVGKHQMVDKLRNPYMVDIIYKITLDGDRVTIVIEVVNRTGGQIRTQKTVHVQNVANNIQTLIRDTVETLDTTMKKSIQGDIYVPSSFRGRIFANERHNIVNFAYNNGFEVGIDEKLHINEGVNVVFKDPQTNKTYLYLIKPDWSIYSSQYQKSVGAYSVSLLLQTFKEEHGH